jgi:two-component system sensor histidine kinase CreC
VLFRSLSAIRGAAELLEEDMGPEQRVRFLTNIRTEAGRIQDIVDRLLELSALENLKVLEKRERIPVPKLVEGVLEGKESLIARKNLSVTFDVPALSHVEGEPFLLRQALSNLVQNAIDFSPENGGLEIKGSEEEGFLKLSVRDHGPGFPVYASSRLFEKFYSLQRPDTGKKSTGLGLNFVKEVALLHNGEITLHNCSDGGVRSVLKIPCL